MKHTIDELMLQRCVDGELTDGERAQLLRALHEQGSVENWKTLALSFIEHQVFSKVFTSDSGSGEMLSFHLARPATPGQTPAPPPETPVPLLHRRVRPWFSVAASLAVGMLVGVGGHFMLNRGDEGIESLATVPADGPQQFVQTGMSAGSGTTHHHSAHQVPTVNVQLTHQHGGEVQSLALPVYSPEEWQSFPVLQSSAPLSPEVLRMLESRGMRVEHEHQWHRARLQDGREILVPTEVMHVRHVVQ